MLYVDSVGSLCMLRARKMSSITQARNAQNFFSGSVPDHIVSPIESISCNLNFRPHLCVKLMIMNHEHMAPIATSVNRKVTSQSSALLQGTENQKILFQTYGVIELGRHYSTNKIQKKNLLLQQRPCDILSSFKQLEHGPFQRSKHHLFKEVFSE